MTVKTSFLVFFCCFCTCLSAQTAEDSVKQTITQFFDGMRKHDTAMMRNTLAETVIFQTIARKKSGELFIRTENVNDFFAQIGKPSTDVLDERIVFDMVKIDGTLASVWTPYQFFLNEKRLHCGANSFQLVRLNGAWRIQYIIDTRRTVNCP